MKEIGQALKEARENIGISIEEAANDLKLRPEQIEDIEEGNKDAFQDIFYLKYFIRDYSKYLGLNYENMVDEFNEFLFDYTSKISLDDIKKAKKQVEVKIAKEEKKISSPYTYERKKKLCLNKYIFIVLISILIMSIFYFGISISQKDDFVKEDTTKQNIIK